MSTSNLSMRICAMLAIELCYHVGLLEVDEFLDVLLERLRVLLLRVVLVTAFKIDVCEMEI